MTLRISGKNLDIGPALRTRAQDDILTAVAKYYEGGYTGHLTVEKEGTGFQTECTLYLNSGRTICVSSAAHDAYASLGLVVERVAKQLRRYKRELKPRKQHEDVLDTALPAGVIAFADAEVSDGAGRDSSASVIVAERSDKLPRYSVTAAAEHMEHRNLLSFVFRNSGTGRVNVLRLREDGSLGWIDVHPGAQTV